MWRREALIHSPVQKTSTGLVLPGVEASELTWPCKDCVRAAGHPGAFLVLGIGEADAAQNLPQPDVFQNPDHVPVRKLLHGI